MGTSMNRYMFIVVSVVVLAVMAFHDDFRN